MSRSSLSNDSVPSALLQKDVLSDCAYCDQALSLPICAVQCAHYATYVPYLNSLSRATISCEYPGFKKIRPCGAWISNPIHILFCLLVLELNIILSLTKCEVCVLQNCHVCACGWRLHAPSKKVWPLLINPLPHPVFSLFSVVE